MNVYSTAHSPKFINGTLRVQLAGQTFATPFRFEVSRGNKGKDIDAVLGGGEDTAHSKRFTVMDIIGTAEVNP